MVSINIGKYSVRTDGYVVVGFTYIKKTINNEIKDDSLNRGVNIEVELSAQENMELEEFFDKVFSRAMTEIDDQI